MIIFLNINLNVRNERKKGNKYRGVYLKITNIVAANIPRLPYTWCRLKAKTFYFTQWSLCEFYFLNLSNIYVNIRNERKNVEKLVGAYF